VGRFRNALFKFYDPCLKEVSFFEHVQDIFGILVYLSPIDIESYLPHSFGHLISEHLEVLADSVPR
jgi:hypothetical protein